MAVTVSLDDAVLRLKAEILAQDWRLSARRAARLEAAFSSLRGHFHDRKAIRAMLIMADNVLGYIKTHGATPPATIDFLKEAMAHVVSLHEDLVVDPKRDEETFQILYLRFNQLRERIRSKGGAASALSTPTLADSVDTKPPEAPAPAAQPPSTEPEAAAETGAVPSLPALIDVFRANLAAAGETGHGLRRLFDLWLQDPAVVALLGQEDAPAAPLPEAEPEPELPPEPEREEEIAPPQPPAPEQISACPPTPVRVFRLGGRPFAISCAGISLIRALSPESAARYLQSATVPLSDFNRFFHKLSSQFSGSLGLTQDRILRQLSLPLVIPQGEDLPETPAADSNTLLVISHGNWHGALLCEDLHAHEQLMIKFARRQNGDLSGTAHLENGQGLALIDPPSLLRREGILLMQ